MTWRAIWLGLLVVAVVAADQASKHFVVKYLAFTGGMDVLPFLKFTVVRNAGAAFGFLSDASGWQNLFFVVVAVIVSFIILSMARKLGANQTFVIIALMLIMGGAIGNVIDRLTLGTGIDYFDKLSNGYVIDFIDFYYRSSNLSCFWPFYPANGGCHFPAFNIADSVITVGAIMMLLDIVGLSPKPKN